MQEKILNCGCEVFATGNFVALVKRCENHQKEINYIEIAKELGIAKNKELESDEDITKVIGFQCANQCKSSKSIEVPRMGKKTFRQWITGMLMKDAAFDSPEAYQAKKDAEEIIEFAERLNLLHPDIKL